MSEDAMEAMRDDDCVNEDLPRCCWCGEYLQDDEMNADGSVPVGRTGRPIHNACHAEEVARWAEED